MTDFNPRSAAYTTRGENMGVVELLLLFLQSFPRQLDPWLGPGRDRPQLVAVDPRRLLRPTDLLCCNGLQLS